MNDELFLDVGNLQNDYENLVKNHKLTKKAICDLCIPFRDKYKLTDLETLKIARNEMSVFKINQLLNR